MPTVSMANFEGDDLLSTRLLSFMANGEQSALNTEGAYHSMVGNNGPLNSACLGVPCSSMLSEPTSFNPNSPIHRSNSATLPQERLTNGVSLSPSPNDTSAYGGSVSIGSLSGSCTPPPTSLSAADPSGNYVSLRQSQMGAPYSALTSPCLSNKLSSLTQSSLINMNGGSSAGDRHSLQNSPFYNHYPVHGNLQSHLHRQFPGISPGPAGALFSNGLNGFNGGSQNLNSRGGLYQDAAFSLPGFRSTNSNSGCPQRELFPPMSLSHSSSNSNGQLPGLLMQDRLHYYAIAQRQGFIVGSELERIKENSRRSTSQSYGRISAYFRNRYGETEAKTKGAYLQLGVRVPSKDHVSEIVGKGGQKIKLIREETGALITTPGEQEEHVFIIEAPPEIAMRVAQHLAVRAQEITQSKIVASERRRGSTSSQPCGGAGGNEAAASLTTNNGNNNGNGTGCVNSTSLTPNSFLTPNLSGPSPSGLLSLGNSATNSPLHPSAGSNGSYGTNGLSSSAANGSSMRSPNGNLFTSTFSSLPTSPGNPSLNSQGQTSVTSSTNGNGLFSSTNTPGNRILLARGRISVPQEMVGKIIGTQGSIITTIQKDTGTEIKSPPKEATRGPNATSEFEISAYQGLGLSSNQAAECRVQQAKQLIGHLVMRQLDRRASEEVDEASGSSNVSGEDQRGNTTNGCNTPRTNTGWMWPDVAQMDSQEAREVLDRILAESKNKTRRAKELAAATAVSAGPSPNSNSTLNAPGGSLMNLTSSNGSQNCTDQLIPHFQSHMLGGGNYFDGPNDNGDLSSKDSVNQESSLLSSNSFNPHGGSNFNLRSWAHMASSSDEQSNNMHLCSPRAMHTLPPKPPGFDLSNPNELLPNMNRAPGSDLVPDLWSSASIFTSGSSTSTHGLGLINSPGGNNTNNNNNSGGGGMDVRNSQLRSLIGSSATLNNLLSHSPPPPLSATATAHPVLNRCFSGRATVGGGGPIDDPIDSSLFNFADSETETVDGSSLLRLQHSDLHQPLTRRHSDWIVNSSNLLSELTNESGRTNPSPGQNGFTLGDNQHHHHQQHHHDSLYSSGGFNFIQALDRMSLNSSCEKDLASASLSHCPPGFEPQPPSVQQQQAPGTPGSSIVHPHPSQLDSVFTFPVKESLSSSLDMWSNNGRNNGLASKSLGLQNHQQPQQTNGNLMISSTSDDRSNQYPTHNSLLQHLFIPPTPSSDESVVLANSIKNSSIWSQNSGGGSSNITGGSVSSSAVSSDFLNMSSYLETTLTDSNKLDAQNPSLGFFSDEPGPTEPTNNNNSNGLNNGHSARCGAIGEGRRRTRPNQANNLLNATDPMAISVSSAIASITEVA